VDGGQRVTAAVEAAGGRALFVRSDAASAEDNEALVAAAVEAFGGLDAAVNNAGVGGTSAPTGDYTVEEWRRVMSINLDGVFFGARAQIPRLVERGGGTIVNIASILGQVTFAGAPAYVAAKHGIVGLTKTVALETARTGITCNAICPGWVLTPLVQKQIDARAAADGSSANEAKVALLSEKQPSQDFVTPQQIGELAAFLCSPAADQVRGVAWAMDGGWTAQ
jgi:3-hydroxybutyrate dehydrogenase